MFSLFGQKLRVIYAVREENLHKHMLTHLENEFGVINTMEVTNHEVSIYLKNHSRATAVPLTSDILACQHNNEFCFYFPGSLEFILEHGVLAMKPFSGTYTSTKICKRAQNYCRKMEYSANSCYMHIII